MSHGRTELHVEFMVAYTPSKRLVTWRCTRVVVSYDDCEIMCAVCRMVCGIHVWIRKKCEFSHTPYGTQEDALDHQTEMYSSTGSKQIVSLSTQDRVQQTRLQYRYWNPHDCYMTRFYCCLTVDKENSKRRKIRDG